MSEIFDPISRPVVAAGRFILWLVWEVVVLWVPWYVGWPVWRVLTLGRFPETAAGDQEEASTLETVLVWGLGFLIMCGVAWLLARPFGSA